MNKNRRNENKEETSKSTVNVRETWKLKMDQALLMQCLGT
jgi:hypothetical protein